MADRLSEAVRDAVEAEMDGREVLEVVFVVATGRKGDNSADITIGNTHLSPSKAREIMLEEALRKVKE